MYKKYLFTAISAGLLLATTYSFGADKTENKDNKKKVTTEEKFLKNDINKDGFLTVDELKNWTKAEQNFSKIDLNNDKKISLEEMKAYIPK